MSGIEGLDWESQPREKFMTLGPEAVSTVELIAILLRTGYKGTSVLTVARDVLAICRQEEQVDSQTEGTALPGRLATMTVGRLQKIKGIGKDKALTLCAAIELGRRLSQSKVKETYADFSQPKAVALYMMERLRYAQEEFVKVALLDVKNRLLRVASIAQGGLSSSLAEQRKVFRAAIEANAASIILIHNHPSG